MSTLDWRRHRPKGGSLTAEETTVATEWEEGWDVIAYVPPAGTPAWIGLVADRPDLFPGSLHPVITSAYVRSFKAEPIGTTKGFRCTVGYRIGDPREMDLPPLERAAEIEVDTEEVEKPNFKQYDGTPWISKAGGLIAGLTKPELHVIFKVSKNVAAVPAWFLTELPVNNDAISIKGLNIPAHYAQVRKQHAGKLTKELVNGIPYLFYPISFELHYNPATWQTKVYNRDLYQIDTALYSGSGYGPCVDEEGEPTQEPCFLDSAGKQLPFPVDPGDIVTLEGWDYPLIAFDGTLPLT